ncbi:MAG: DUF1679 domain-containing protein [Chloroflexi bacterium]|nr:DUF1679 domain-containing protein [Chloroflexota bacterium]
MGNGELPGGPSELTAEWLTASLRETGTISGGTSVASFETETIGEGEGLLGQLARVTLSYEGAGGGEPETLVAKFPSEVEGNRDLANLFHFYEREVRFYEEIAEEVELRTPKRYFSRFDPERGVFVILMEDLSSARVGNQVAGCSPDEAVETLERIARFHATWWDSPKLASLDWIPLGNDPVNQSAEQAYQDAWPGFVENFGNRLSAKAMSVAERFATKIIAIQNAMTKAPLTICHGDLRYDNLFFSPGDMVVADWQIVVRSRGPYDVGYFMSQSVNPDDRKACEMDVIHRYHDTLMEHGVSNYSFDQCMEDYRAAAMFCLVYPVISGGSLDLANERGVALVTAMLDRSVATIVDLNCDEMIPG